MALKPTIKIIQERRAQLFTTLQANRLDPAKQHQVYGAVKELDLVLKILEMQNEKLTLFQEKNELQEFTNSSPNEKQRLEEFAQLLGK